MKKFALIALTAALVGAPAYANHHEEKKAPLNFKAMDTDGSKTVSAAEWEAGNRNPKAFPKVDADGNGQITPEEMKAHQERVKAMQAAKAAQ